MKTRKDFGETPILTTKTRDLRWNSMKEMMRENDVECLLVLSDPALFGVSCSDNYFTNDLSGAVVVFPLEGEPVGILAQATGAGTQMLSEERGEPGWIEDWRFASPKNTVVEVIKEKGLDKARIGSIGALRAWPFYGEGYVPYSMWKFITESLPDVTFVELYDQFKARIMEKGEEEVAVFRHACAISEAVGEAMLAAVKPGVSEGELFAVIEHEIYSLGASCGFINLHTGLNNPSWQRSKWLFRPQKQRVVENQDVILCEIGPSIGFIQAQIQMCIAVGEVSERVEKLSAICRESYEIGVNAIKPGVTFQEVALAMRAPLVRENAWHLTPLIHSLNPLAYEGAPTEGIRDIPGLTDRFQCIQEVPMTQETLVLKEGMTLQLEPNACYERQRVNIGGNILVTATGAEELNDLPCRMLYVK